MSEHALEVARGQRFEFGLNWSRFLATLSEEKIAEAQASLASMIGSDKLTGKRFLDAGSGSGLFSLAARRMGAEVRSFDFDPKSVACTSELKQRYFSTDPAWTVSEGSVLDQDFLGELGQFDIVYSWGVLHHTGSMWQALENVAPLVAPGGTLFISIYNDQGRGSRYWTAIKKAYCRLPKGLKFLVVGPSLVRLWGPTSVRDLLRGRPFKSWRTYGRERGMSPWWDVIDWVGGYPFEVATPDEIFDFYSARGFTLRKLKTCGGGHGCNEFVFTRAEADFTGAQSPR